MSSPRTDTYPGAFGRKEYRPRFIIDAIKALFKKGPSTRDAIRRLIDEDPRKTVDNCLTVLSAFAREARDRHCRAEAVASLLDILDSDARNRFCARVIATNALQRGRIQALLRLQYAPINPIVLVDFLFSNCDVEELVKAVKMFPQEKVVEILEFVAAHFDEPDVIIARMRRDECFESYEPEKDRCNTRRLRQFFTASIKTLGVDVPYQVSVFYLVANVRSNLASFLRHEMESSDFYAVCEALTRGDARLWNVCVDLVYRECPSLASFVSTRAGLVSRPYDDVFVPTCEKNDALHRLPHREYVVIDNDASVEDFQACVRDAYDVFIDFHGGQTTKDVRRRVMMIVFVCRKGIFFFFPGLHPQVKDRVADALRRSDLTFLVARWEQEPDMFQSVFGWKPTKVMDAVTIAREEKIPDRREVYAQMLTGGKLCKRASNFSDQRIPSHVALTHRAIRACLVFDFIAKFRRVDERVRNLPSSGERGKRSQDDRDDSPDFRRSSKSANRQQFV